MSREQATQKLAAMQAAYDPPPVGLHARTPTEASQMLEQLGQTPDFLHKLQNGDIAARDVFQRLTAMKAAAMPGELTAEPILETTVGDTGLSRRSLLSVAADMRAEQVWNDKGIEFILSDGKFPTGAVRDAQFWLPQLERDETVLCPDLPEDWPHKQQVKFLKDVITIGDGSTP
jgi:hypothetical protein